MYTGPGGGLYTGPGGGLYTGPGGGLYTGPSNPPYTRNWPPPDAFMKELEKRGLKDIIKLLKKHKFDVLG
ncbi:hypothetical protein FW415_08590 [Chitinophaga sp. XS-30]|nr:hypothetical protein FW415_08590 [Chitinophaga sp. XS-30]